MRFGGGVLSLIGLLAAIVFTWSGCGTFFTWNGRHPVFASELSEGRANLRVPAIPGRRYTVSVKAVFDPATVGDHEGMAAVEAKLPLVLRAKDPSGTTLSEVVGWLDPAEPPNVFYTRPLRRRDREVSVERLAAPFGVATEMPLTIEVELGADRVGKVAILERRVVVYDDALPPSLRSAAIGAGAGVITLLLGLVLLAVGRRRKRSGFPRGDVV